MSGALLDFLEVADRAGTVHVVIERCQRTYYPLSKTHTLLPVVLRCVARFEVARLRRILSDDGLRFLLVFTLVHISPHSSDIPVVRGFIPLVTGVITRCELESVCKHFAYVFELGESSTLLITPLHYVSSLLVGEREVAREGKHPTSVLVPLVVGTGLAKSHRFHVGRTFLPSKVVSRSVLFQSRGALQIVGLER